MRLSTLVSTITLAAGAASQNTWMLTLYGVPGLGSFSGVGVPGQCQNLPANIQTFSRAVPMQGFRCYIYEQLDCSGSHITVPGLMPFGLPRGPAAPRPVWQSWMCTCLNCVGPGPF